MTTTIYYHKHHIIPRHMGGNDESSNLVKLTISGHIAVHKWLYEEYGCWQDRLAYQRLSGVLGKEEFVHQLLSEASKKSSGFTGKKHSDESKCKISKTMREEVVNDEYRQKLSDSKMGDKNHFFGKTHSEETKKQISKNKTNPNEETRKRISEAAKRRPPVSEETKRKMSKCRLGKRFPKVTCPYCGKEGALNMMKRYHFENCKNYERLQNKQ